MGSISEDRADEGKREEHEDGNVGYSYNPYTLFLILVLLVLSDQKVVASIKSLLGL